MKKNIVISSIKSLLKLLLVFNVFIIMGSCCYAADKLNDNWYLNPYINGNTLNSIASNGKGLNIAVGVHGIIRLSENGGKWLNTNSGTNEDLFDCLWDGKEFVVTGRNGMMLASKDGIGWNKISTGTKRDLTKIYLVNNKLFINAIAYKYSNGKVISNILSSQIIVADSLKDLRTLPFNYNMPISDVTYFNMRYIIVFNHKDRHDFTNKKWFISGCDILTSQNTYSWKTTALDSKIFDMADNGKVLVAVGNSMLKTVDGVNWNEIKPSIFSGVKGDELHRSISLKKVIWNGSKFISMGIMISDDWKNIFLSSKDGLGWEAKTRNMSTNYNDTSDTNDANDIPNANDYGNYSELIWTGKDYAAIVPLYRIEEYGAGGRCLDELNQIEISHDGLTWVGADNNGKTYMDENYIIKINYDGKNILGIGTGSKIFMASKGETDKGDSFNISDSTDSQINNKLSNIFWDGQEFIAFSEEPLPYKEYIYNLKNVINWAKESSDIPQKTNGGKKPDEIIKIHSTSSDKAIWNGKFFVGVGPYDIYTSDNCKDITLCKTETSLTLTSYKLMAYSNGKYLFLDTENHKAAFTTDFKNWEIKKINIIGSGDDLNVNGYPDDLIYGGGKYVMIKSDYYNYKKQIYNSTDGVNWELVYSLPEPSDKMTVRWSQLYYIDNRFLVTVGNEIFTSLEGKDWNICSINKLQGTEAGILKSIRKLDNELICVGDNGTILVSTDGVKWYQQKSPINDNLVDAAEGNGQIIIVSENGDIIYNTASSNSN